MRKQARGVTLLELLITVAVSGILLGIGVPSFQRVHERVRANNALHLLTTSLAGARLAAITRQRPFSVCPSRDGSTCRNDAVWDDGWIVYEDMIDRSRTGAPKVVAHHVSGVGAGLNLRSTVGRQRVRFQPNGRAYGSNVSIRLCATHRRDHLGTVIINNSGRARVERIAAGQCPFTQ